MSIATMRGDGGETGLAGGMRVSKASLRVETYGTVDELISALGFARAICADGEVRQVLKQIQQDLFQVGSALRSCTPEQVVREDCKEFQESNRKFSISQIEEIGDAHRRLAERAVFGKVVVTL